MTASSARTRDINIYGIRKRKGKTGTGHVVRWTTAGREHQKTFKTAKLADGYRSGLLTAAQGGELFHVASGSNDQNLWMALGG